MGTENFSKIVRSLLLDIDLSLDQLVQIGYFNGEQRDFMDKYLYKSEDALQVAHIIVRSLGDATVENKVTSIKPSLSKVHPVFRVPIAQVPALSTEGFRDTATNTDQNVLDSFVKRCNARNFTVKVSGPDVAKESKAEDKASDFVISLAPIDEVVVNAGSLSSEETKVNYKEPSKSPRNDTDMMRHGVRVFGGDTGAEPIHYDDITSSAPATTIPANGSAQTNNQYECKEIQTARKIVIVPPKATKTNMWGKKVKSATQNEDGDIVGGSAQPIGPDNKGRVIMEKMGWSSGIGLGRKEDGILEPLAHSVKNLKTGLGAVNIKPVTFDLNLPPSENTSISASAQQPEWDKSVELSTQQVRAAAMIAAGRTSEATSTKRDASYKSNDGIRAKFVSEGAESDFRNIKLTAKIFSIHDWMQTRHFSGVVVKALTSQEEKIGIVGSRELLRVDVGDYLQIEGKHGGHDYFVANLRTRKRGLVKISSVEMDNKPEHAEYEAGEEAMGWTSR